MCQTQSIDRRRRIQFRVGCFFAFAVLVALVAYLAYQRAVRGVVDYYAVMEVADILGHHAATHPDEPPKDWSDLEDAYQYINPAYNSTLEELKERVHVDFDRLALWAKSSGEASGLRSEGPVISVKGNDQLKAAEEEANERVWAALTK